GAAVPALSNALTDQSPQVRVLAAVAIKAMGPTAAGAVPALVRALDEDSDENVRVTVAAAFGAMGDAAKAAVPALADKLQRGDPSYAVLGSVATALGNIGPAAAGAIPALEVAVKSIGPSAQEAILRVQGKPVPTWW